MSELTPKMYYFGPWDKAGHYVFDERGRHVPHTEECQIPWGHEGQNVGIDGVLQPGCVAGKSQYTRSCPEVEGEALLHHKDGWTALSFWDRSVDRRPACNSTYMAQGIFTFEQMVGMAMIRFKHRWDKMYFEVRLYKPV